MRLLFVDEGESEWERLKELLPWEEYGIRLIHVGKNSKERLEQFVEEIQTSYRENKEDGCVMLAREEEGRFIFLSPKVSKSRIIHRLILENDGERMVIWGQYPNVEQEREKRNIGKRLYLEWNEEKEKAVLEAARQILECENRKQTGVTALNVCRFTGIAEIRSVSQWPPRPFPAQIVPEPEVLKEAYVYLKTSQRPGIKISYLDLKEKACFEELLFELNLMFCKLRLLLCSFSEMLQICRTMTGTLYHGGAEKLEERGIKEGDFKGLCQGVQQIVAEESFCGKSGEEMKLNRVLQAVYLNLGNKNLGVNWLCRTVLHMNEDYFGRLFVGRMHEKFSTYVMKTRMETAKALIVFEPEITVSRLAQLVGYDEDGQHFSRVFKKYTGISPSAYKERETAIF